MRIQKVLFFKIFNSFKLRGGASSADSSGGEMQNAEFSSSSSTSPPSTRLSSESDGSVTSLLPEQTSASSSMEDEMTLPVAQRTTVAEPAANSALTTRLSHVGDEAGLHFASDEFNAMLPEVKSNFLVFNYIVCN